MVSSYNDSPQLVYHLNRCFETKFERINDLDVVIDNQLIYFPIFEWENPDTGDYYNIIKNIAYSAKHKKQESSLSTMFDITPALISQFKEYNFLLKVTGDCLDKIPFQENSFIQKISKLRTDKVKLIERLIF